MSYEELKSFILSAQKNTSMNKKINECTNIKSFLILAKNSGYDITENDFKDLKEKRLTNEWFSKSQLNQIRKCR